MGRTSSQRERERLGALLRKSKGRRSNLSARERDELWSLVKKAAIEGLVANGAQAAAVPSQAWL